MKKELKIIAIVLGIMLLITIVFKGISYTITQTKEKHFSNSNIETNTDENDNMKVQMKAVVVKVDNTRLSVIKSDNPNELINLGFTEEGNIGYEQGQEILIYYDGNIMTSYPEQLGNVGKIEIVKEKSDIEIPEDILKFCFSSQKEVNVDIIELTTDGIELNITDSNELSYNYSHNYKIYKEVKNENYTGVGYQVGESTENSTAGFSGTSFEYVWKEMDVISNISSENTEIFEDESDGIIKRKFDWTPIYGELESGKYEFVLGDDDSLGIRIFFTIDLDGNISYNEPEYLY